MTGAEVAPLLRAAAAGRRDMARAVLGTNMPDKEHFAHDLETQAHTLDDAAAVAEGALGPLYNWLPSHRWTDEMLTALYGERKPA